MVGIHLARSLKVNIEMLIEDDTPNTTSETIKLQLSATRRLPVSEKDLQGTSARRIFASIFAICSQLKEESATAIGVAAEDQKLQPSKAVSVLEETSLN